MALQNLRSLFLEHLRLLHSGEHQLAKALPRVAVGVASQEAKSLLRDYQADAESRCEQMEAISRIVTEPLGGERCGVMEAFSKHAVSLSELRGDDRVLDLAVMTTLRQIGHFEKSCYEIARSFAEVLEEVEVLKILERMLTDTEEAERALILLTEDMMDSLTHQRGSEEKREPRIAPRDLAS